MSKPEPVAETVRLFRDSWRLIRNAAHMLAATVSRVREEALRVHAGLGATRAGMKDRSTTCRSARRAGSQAARTA